MKIKIEDYKNLPFGTHITVKTLNNSYERAVSIRGEIAFEDGYILSMDEMTGMEIYLGWTS